MLAKLAPFLILAAGAVGLYFLWTRVFRPKGDQPVAATDDTRAYGEKVAADAAAACAAKGGVFTRPSSGESNCTLPENPAVRQPVNYGGCPDLQSCKGYDPRSGVTQPPNVPAPPANQPTGNTLLLFSGARAGIR